MSDNNIKLAELMFPDIKKTPQDMEQQYPKRNLPDNACVTRIAPSPTGFVHLGNLESALIDATLARQSGGVFCIRIEDTDQKREVEGAIETIFDVFNWLELKFDEGFQLNGDIGSYGPYIQSQREDIYKVFAKQLVAEGKAYPCFCSQEDMDKIKEEQKDCGENTGYYGKWATCRNLSFDETEQKIKDGESYMVRFKSPGDESKRINVIDLIKGLLDPPENIRDEVVLKSDGLPTYHFAHAIDDHLMRTTHVVRGEEYLSTLPIHVQFFEAFGWTHPHYMHHSHLLKMEGESKRKLSKRKDPELSLVYYIEKGYLPQCLKEYIMTLLNSNYEEWRIENPKADMSEFKFTVEKLSPSGALFDLNKLNDISKNYISQLTTDEIYDAVVKWADMYDKEFGGILTKSPQYAKDILSIGRGGEKPRKDIAFLSEIKNYVSYFYDELFVPDYTMPENIAEKIAGDDIKNIVRDYIDIYNGQDDQNMWFDRIKELSGKYGFAPEMKLYRKNPQDYKGSVGDVSMILRVAICGRTNSPDMYDVFKIMGKEMIQCRLRLFCSF